jgi:cytochrome P450
MGLHSRWTGKRRTPPLEPLRIASPEFKANPFPCYARLRAEAPARRVTMLSKETAWLVTRYDDVAMVLKDERFAKDAANALTPGQAANRPWFRKLKVFQSMQRNMVNLDPPDHTRLRALVGKAFTPRLIEQMRERVQALTDELLDNVHGRRRIDLIRDYALPLPATIIAEMLGVPVEDHLFQLADAQGRSPRFGIHALHAQDYQGPPSRSSRRSGECSGPGRGSRRRVERR